MNDFFQTRAAIELALANPHAPYLLKSATWLLRHEQNGAWWSFAGITNRVAKFRVAGFIDNGAEQFIERVKEFPEHRVVLEIDSEGGNVDAGLLVAMFMQNVDSTAIVTNASSSAAFLACGCRRISIYPHGRFLVHPIKTFVGGTSKQLRIAADHLDNGATTQVRELLKGRVKSLADLNAWLTEGNHEYIGQAAVNVGLADDLVLPSEPAVTATPPASDANVSPPIDDRADHLAAEMVRLLRLLAPRVNDRKALAKAVAPLANNKAKSIFPA